MTTPAPEQGTHFWFLTVQNPNATGFYMNCYQGTWNPRSDQTRLDLFNAIYDYVQDMDPRARGGTTIAFDIQPNQL